MRHDDPVFNLVLRESRASRSRQPPGVGIEPQLHGGTVRGGGDESCAWGRVVGQFDLGEALAQFSNGRRGHTERQFPEIHKVLGRVEFPDVVGSLAPAVVLPVERLADDAAGRLAGS